MQIDPFQLVGHCVIHHVCWSSLVRDFTSISYVVWYNSIGFPSVPVAFRLGNDQNPDLTSSSTVVPEVLVSIEYLLRYLEFLHLCLQYFSASICLLIYDVN